MPLLNDISLGRYIARDSLVHNLDPRTKGLGVILGMISTIKIADFPGLSVAMVILLLILLLSKLSLGDLLKNFKGFAVLFILTFILHLLFTPSFSDKTINILGLRIGELALRNGLFYCGRIALLLGFSYLFMATTSPLEIADGLEQVLRPLEKIRFPAHETAMVIAIALRFVPTILDEAKRIRDAQLCRGARLQGNLIAKTKGFSAMLIPLFASALRRADTLSLAMTARGYRGGEGRSSYVELRFKTSDFIAIAISIVFISGLWVI